MATSTTLAINPWLYKKLPYDPAKDFAAVGMIGAVPLVAVVNASVPANYIAQMIELAKSKPGQVRNGSAGNGRP